MEREGVEEWVLRICSWKSEMGSVGSSHIIQDSKSVTYAVYSHWTLFIRHRGKEKIINNIKRMAVKH